MLETQCLLRISGPCPGYERPQYRSWWPALPGRPQTNDTFLTRTACTRAQHGWQETCGHLASVRLKLSTLAPTQKRRASPPLSSPSSQGTDNVDVGAPAVAATVNDAPSTSFWIYSLQFKTPHLARLQGETIVQFLKHDADVFLVSTSCVGRDTLALQGVARELNAISSPLDTPPRPSAKHFRAMAVPPRNRSAKFGIRCHDSDYSRKEGMAYDWCVHGHMRRQQAQPKYFGFVHSDMFLVHPFDVRPYLDVRGIYGSPSTYAHASWHLHPQLMFMRTDRWPLAIAEFGPACACKNGTAPACCMDTGGAMINAFQLGDQRMFVVPKRLLLMFEESKVNLMLGTPNVEQALEGPLSAFSDALAGLNHALKHDSFDPRTNESYPFGAQYEAYEYFGDAWVHSRHSKLVELSVRGVDVRWTPALRRSPWWAHPKNAYIKGLVDCRLWLACNPNDRAAVTKPSGEALPLNSNTVKAATDQLVRLASGLAGTTGHKGILQLLQPDNAYVKGCLDATMRFRGRTEMQTQVPTADGSSAAPGWPEGVTTRPGTGSC